MLYNTFYILYQINYQPTLKLLESLNTETGGWGTLNKVFKK